jgi:hypothetical protein
MLTIRADQMAVFRSASMERFVDAMADHLERCFAEWTEPLGRQAVKDFVRHGIERAKAYGFETELEVARYLHAMQALGKEFDQSSEFPWAAKLLRKKIPASVKMNRLRDAVDYQKEARRMTHA